MRKKKRNPSSSGSVSSGFGNLPDTTDFYSGGPDEQPLYRGRSHADAAQIRKTDRHQAVGGRPKEAIDLRERMALLSILKALVMVLLLVIAFFMLWKGIKIYEESVWLDSQEELETSPVLEEMVLPEEYGVEEQAQEQFAERIVLWKESERLVQFAETLLRRDNYDEAIARCQEALRMNPAHTQALDLLGQLYEGKGAFVKSANAYIRLLSVDPVNDDVQKRLIAVLDQVGDQDAVIHMSKWYLDANVFDVQVQRHLANALYASENFEEAAEAYTRVLREEPANVLALERKAAAYMQLERYSKALTPLKMLRNLNYKKPEYYRHIAICQAQLGQGYETIQILGRASQVFSEKLVMGWMAEPLLDPVRDDRNFRAFADHVGGEGFREWLDQLAKGLEAKDDKAAAGAMISVEKEEKLTAELLQPSK